MAQSEKSLVQAQSYHIYIYLDDYLSSRKPQYINNKSVIYLDNFHNLPATSLRNDVLSLVRGESPSLIFAEHFRLGNHQAYPDLWL